VALFGHLLRFEPARKFPLTYGPQPIVETLQARLQNAKAVFPRLRECRCRHLPFFAKSRGTAYDFNALNPAAVTLHGRNTNKPVATARSCAVDSTELRLTPDAWSKCLSGLPTLDRSVPALVPALVRRWQGIDPQISQASLDQHFVSIHLGGAKRLHRRGEGHYRTRDIADVSFSIVPAGAAFEWNTEGPVDFAHIYFDPAIVDHVIADAFDRDPSSVVLQEGLGDRDPLLATLALSLLEELDSEALHRAYLDDLTHLLLCRILRLHSNANSSTVGARHTLAPFRLRRAIEFIESNLSRPIGVAEIAMASGISAYHFSRAFRQATGRAPYAYLTERRIECAKLMLARHETTLTAIAQHCGFSSLSQFSRTFRQETGATPSSFRDRR
jgi:AraC family transcriptional regulator